MHSVTVLLIGYSVFSALVIALTQFRPGAYREQRLPQLMGIGLLLTLAALQVFHFVFLQFGIPAIHSPAYRMLLFAVAPGFHLFSNPLLHAQESIRRHQAFHFVPVLVAPLLPFAGALPLSFAVGACYLGWLANSIYALRAQRSRFRTELTILAVVFVIAVVVFLLGMSLPWLGEERFVVLYAAAIGCAFVLVSLALGLAPQLSTEVAEVARETYAVSTLTHVDRLAAVARLESLLQQDRLYERADLDLSTLASQVGLSGHQLSELINTQLCKSFPRYLREYRVEAAKRMLLEEPGASVLSVGMSVGFTSQSNFYDAFREITGTTPGKFRNMNSPSAPE